MTFHTTVARGGRLAIFRIFSYDGYLYTAMRKLMSGSRDSGAPCLVELRRLSTGHWESDCEEPALVTELTLAIEHHLKSGLSGEAGS
ncbi:MAG: hypothetical protein JWP27_1003 [Flaviaesturariibacter sp.]|nr:hypothetical protein [Flaviaesturariibacter sp.]